MLTKDILFGFNILAVSGFPFMGLPYTPAGNSAAC
jgi:hypothetical protein